MQIVGMPLLSDNYAWLLWNEGGADCAVVDPSEAAPVAAAIAARGLSLRWILATHHHPDHVGGIAGLAESGVEVVASRYDSQRVPCVTRTVEDGSVLTLLDEEVRCLWVPGHTLGAVAYYLPKVHAVFTGDTLFTAGCGRLFEGSAAQMHASLSVLAALPAATQVYCGHEYTEKNLRFAAHLEPDSVAVRRRLQEVSGLRAQNKPTVPAPLELEKSTNPFLRSDSPTMANITGQPAGPAAFAELRRRRDHF